MNNKSSMSTDKEKGTLTNEQHMQYNSSRTKSFCIIIEMYQPCEFLLQDGWLRWIELDRELEHPFAACSMEHHHTLIITRTKSDSRHHQNPTDSIHYIKAKIFSPNCMKSI